MLRIVILGELERCKLRIDRIQWESRCHIAFLVEIVALRPLLWSKYSVPNPISMYVVLRSALSKVTVYVCTVLQSTEYIVIGHTLIGISLRELALVRSTNLMGPTLRRVSV